MKYKINEAYRPIAEKLVNKFDELQGIPVRRILFVENTETIKKKANRIIYAQVGTVPEKWSEIIKQETGKVYDFIIEIFRTSTVLLTQNQIVAIIYHELRHIQTIDMEWKVVPHDIEDWTEMLEHLGPEWNAEGADLPDLLDEDIQWEDITPNTLFDEAQTTAD